MTARHPLVVELLRLTADLGKSLDDVADMTGVSHAAPDHWARGKRSPSVTQAARWATALGRRLVVAGGGLLWAEGEQICDVLAVLRQARGVGQADIAAARGVSEPAISQQEAPGAYKRLHPTEEYLRALGLELALMEAS